jgi:hypothetical protein
MIDEWSNCYFGPRPVGEPRTVRPVPDLAPINEQLLLAIIRKRIFLEVGRRVFGGMAELKSKVFQIAVG